METESKALKAKYSYTSRFEEGKGTNPEELIAAAHAGCFTQAFTLILGQKGYKPEKIVTTGAVSIDPANGGFLISSILLVMEAKIHKIKEKEFMEIANMAKENCPVSKALASVPKIELQAKLL